MEQYRYKKASNNPRSTIELFEKGKTYPGYRDTETGLYYISITRGEDISMPMYPFSYKEFWEHFYTVDELREIEINKVLNDIELCVDI
tara:strand:+ start:566 stop:829 length:264 start_codon:yes stop_codon:yes gene_type:complete